MIRFLIFDFFFNYSNSQIQCFLIFCVNFYPFKIIFINSNFCDWNFFFSFWVFFWNFSMILQVSWISLQFFDLLLLFFCFFVLLNEFLFVKIFLKFFFAWIFGFVFYCMHFAGLLIFLNFDFCFKFIILIYYILITAVIHLLLIFCWHHVYFSINFYFPILMHSIWIIFAYCTSFCYLLLLHFLPVHKLISSFVSDQFLLNLVVLIF